MANELARLIASGQLREGDELFHTLRPRAKGEFTAHVADDGLVVRGNHYPSPSTAARALAGYASNGWLFWRHRPSGLTLAELRREVRSRTS